MWFVSDRQEECYAQLSPSLKPYDSVNSTKYFRIQTNDERGCQTDFVADPTRFGSAEIYNLLAA